MVHPARVSISLFSHPFRSLESLTISWENAGCEPSGSLGNPAAWTEGEMLPPLVLLKNLGLTIEGRLSTLRLHGGGNANRVNQLATT